MNADWLETIAMFLVLGVTLALICYGDPLFDFLATRRRKKRIAEENRALSRWRARNRFLLNQDVDDEAVMLAIIADKRKEDVELTLIEFECGSCKLRFWTEVGPTLPPSHCPHCGKKFTRIEKTSDVCYAN